ncbi:MAG: Uma2 family endonuclease, partial [Methylococcaceae bacterium]
ADVAVVIEVAETSVQRDRGIKLALYARARLPEYWIVNLPERQIEIYRKPDGQAVYAECQVFKNEDAVTLSLTGTVVATQKVSALLP